jgi:hypothetical protein
LRPRFLATLSFFFEFLGEIVESQNTMSNSANCLMDPADWEPTPIERGKYFNPDHPLRGYARADGLGGNPLHPACAVEDRLAATRAALARRYPALHVRRYHVKMPYWDPAALHLPDAYALVEAPERLTTTSITVATLPQDALQGAEMGFYFDGAHLPSLRERLRGRVFQGIASNLGYYMTRGLIQDKFPWSHNRRYPDFPLPVINAYLGFHLFRDPESGEARTGFQGAHPAAVAVRVDSWVEIIPRLEVDAYRVTLGGQEFRIDSINDAHNVADVTLFTPAWRVPRAHEADWQSYAPEIPLPDRVNLFLANEGDGRVPVERIVRVWQGRAPLPSFGAVLSFDREAFQRHFARSAASDLLGQQVKIEPLSGTNLDDFTQVMGGFVPAVVDGAHILCAETAEEVEDNLRKYGNATSPIAEAARESRNFDLRVREPAGVLAQTEERVGWALFDGRHELSIGASVADVGRLLKLLEAEGAFDGTIQQAIFIDGGSAMKLYAIESDGAEARLELLNRVAAGSRNGPGVDPDGLNLYSLLSLRL